RLLTKLSESNVLDKVQEKLVFQANKEGYIIDDTIAIDATHFEARDQTPPKQDKPKSEPKKRGRKPKAEREQWLKEKAEKEANLPIYEKKTVRPLDVPLDELRRESRQTPRWAVKKSSAGKNEFWFGYKGHLAVGTSSQYILQSFS